MSQPLDLTRTYLHLDAANGATPMPGGDAFWSDIDPRCEEGRLVCALRYTTDWGNWERHPDGEELVLLLEGSVDLVLELPEGEQVVELRGRGGALVPRGVWHRAIVNAPSDVLHVTPGKGTEHRPVA